MFPRWEVLLLRPSGILLMISEVLSESFSCTITEATSTYVKGTFSGVLYMATDSAVVSKTVDGGEFYAKFY